MREGKEKKHLPRFGVGPAYCFGIAIVTAAAVWPAAGALGPGVTRPARTAFGVLGSALVAAGALLWILALWKAGIGNHIRENKLMTGGVYSWVRNPIYSGCLSACTGVLLLAGNLTLLILPVIYWACLTALMKRTEEKWLEKLYGQQYRDYCRRVNRCIPWFPA